MDSGIYGNGEDSAYWPLASGGIGLQTHAGLSSETGKKNGTDFCKPTITIAGAIALPLELVREDKVTGNTTFVPPVDAGDRILVIRGRKVILDRDLAELYGVGTKVLNQAVKRNARRFPSDFAFRLSLDEKKELVTICDRFQRLKHSTALPMAFTEHGALMAATVLNSEQAVQMSILVVRAFAVAKRILANYDDLRERLDELEAKVSVHDESILSLLTAIRGLLTPSAAPPRRIGFQVDEDDGRG